VCFDCHLYVIINHTSHWLWAGWITAGAQICLLFSRSRLALGPIHPHTESVLSPVSPRAKRPICQAAHSSSSGAKVKQEWSCSSFSLYAVIKYTRTTLPLSLSLGSCPHFPCVILRTPILQLAYDAVSSRPCIHVGVHLTERGEECKINPCYFALVYHLCIGNMQFGRE